MKRINIKDMPKEEWLKLRNKYIGASEAAAACGLNKYKSEYQLWLEKTGQCKPFEGNLRTDLGLYMEEFIKEKAQEQKGFLLSKPTDMLVSEEHPFMACNIDYLVEEENVPFECKTSSDLDMNNWDMETPEHYYIQCQHQMIVYGCDHMYIACYFFVLGKLLIKKISKSPAICENLISLEKSFWDKVKNNKPPELCHLDEDLINEKNSQENDSTIELSAIYEYDIERYKEISTLIKELEEEKKDIQVRLKDALGNNKYAIYKEHKIQWNRSQAKLVKEFDKDSFKIEYSELYEKYSVNKEIKTREYWRVK